MQNNRITLFMSVAAIVVAALVASSAFAADFTLTSPDVASGEPLAQAQVLNGFGCSGGNLSPELHWANPPQGTKSFALTVYDPDAPTGSGWWHWVVYDIPATVNSLAEGAGSREGLLPKGAVQGRTDFGAPGYGGACPPEGHGDHHYVFTLFALDVASLDLPPQSSAAMVGFFLNGHSLGKAEIAATYGR